MDVGTCPHQVLVATLTLSQPGGKILSTLYWCPHQVLKATGAPGGDNLPSPVRIGLTDLTNIGGASGPPGPPGSSTTATHYTQDKSDADSKERSVTDPSLNLLCFFLFDRYCINHLEDCTIQWYRSTAMAVKVILERYTATAEEVLTIRHKFSVSFPKGQYLVKTSIAVKGMVQLNNKSEVARSPIKMFLADFRSSRLLASATRTKQFPETANTTKIA